jgi:hypothetical protein
VGYGLDDRVFESRQGLGMFLFAAASRPSRGPTQTPIQREPGALFLGVKWPGREAYHSPPTSAEVRNKWSYTHYAFMAWCSVNGQGQLYLTRLMSDRLRYDIQRLAKLGQAQLALVAHTSLARVDYATIGVIIG